MNSRERVLTTIECRAPDRIPIDFWAVGEVYQRLADELGVDGVEGVLERFDVDVRFFRGPGAAAIEPDADGVSTDHWGVKRKCQTVTDRRADGIEYTWTYKHMVAAPLAGATSTAEIEAHSWPDPARWDYSQVKAACHAAGQSGCAVIFGGDRLDRTAQLKAGMYLRGVEQFVMDLCINPDIAECILARVAEYYLEYNRRVFETADGAIDVFFMGDDMGTQNSTWVSPEMYGRFFKKRFSQFNALAHSFGIKTMYHTCGRVTDLIGEFVDAGLDVLQSLQPGPMNEDFAKIKRQYGRDLCFQGGIDIQDVLPHGTPEDIRRHVQETAGILGAGGGYIFGTAHNILPDTPTENILALIDAYHEFGGYE